MGAGLRPACPRGGQGWHLGVLGPWPDSPITPQSYRVLCPQSAMILSPWAELAWWGLDPGGRAWVGSGRCWVPPHLTCFLICPLPRGPGPAPQEGLPLLLSITSWDCPKNVLQASFPPNLILSFPPSPGFSTQGLGHPSHRPQPTPADHRTQRPHLGSLPSPTHPPERLMTMPGAGTLHTAPPSLPQRPTPGDPRPPGCLPLPTSPLTVLMSWRREGH